MHRRLYVSSQRCMLKRHAGQNSQKSDIRHGDIETDGNSQKWSGDVSGIGGVINYQIVFSHYSLE